MKKTTRRSNLPIKAGIRFLIPTAISLFLAALIFAPSLSAQSLLTPVLISEAKSKQIEDRVEAIGTLRANEQVTISALTTKTVSAIHFDDNQRVGKGQLLVEMTSVEESALLEEARAEVKEAKLQYERVIPLRERGAIPISTFDERKRNYETALARLKATESRLKDLIILAPFDGVLGLRNISVGALVSPGTVITTIDDDSVMKLDFSVPSVFVTALNPGLNIIARSRDIPNKEFFGTVASLDSRIDEVTRSMVVRAIIPNDGRLLKPGMLMTVELKKNPREAILIREEALISFGNRHSVFIVEASDDQEIIRSQPVEIGSRKPGEVEIISGLKEGEKVVVHGTMLIRNGSRVRTVGMLREGDNVAQLLSEISRAQK